jgi:hypothetical protein
MLSEAGKILGPATNPHAGNTSPESDGQNQSQMVANEDFRAALAAEQARLETMKDGKKNGEG